MNSNSRRLLVALGAAGLALAAAPALSQTVGELTVIGKWGPGGPQTLSRAVDISDLDLRTDVGVREMRSRVSATARDICRELEGPGNGGPSGLVRSCQDDAIRSAQAQMTTAIAQARTGPPLALSEPYVAPVGETAPAADVSGEAASATVPAEPTYTTTTVTNGPVADTPENRAKFGGPMSNAGKRTAAAGN